MFVTYHNESPWFDLNGYEYLNVDIIETSEIFCYFHADDETVDINKFYRADGVFIDSIGAYGYYEEDLMEKNHVYYDPYSYIGEEETETVFNNVRKIIFTSEIRRVEYKELNKFPYLETFEIPEENEYFAAYDGALYTKDMKTLLYVPLGKENLTIHENCQDISAQDIDLYNICKGERNTNCPSNPIEAESIKIPAPALCPKLKDITISKENKNLQAIDGNIFSISDKKLILSLGINIDKAICEAEIIGEGAFAGLNFRAEKIPSQPQKHFIYGNSGNIKQIQKGAFAGLPVDYALFRFINSAGNIESIEDFAFYKTNIDNYLSSPDVYNEAPYWDYDSPAKFPDSLKKIGNYAFWGTKIKITSPLPDKLEYLGKDAFDEIPNTSFIPKQLKYLGNFFTYSNEIINGVKEIPALYFQNNPAEKIIIPDTVESIGYTAFLNCKNLKEIRIPKSIKKIDYSPFEGCVNLETAYIPKHLENYRSIFPIFTKIYIYTDDDEDVLYINQGVKYIDKDYFRNNQFEDVVTKNKITVRNIVIPDSVEKIASHAFELFKYVKEITVPESVKYIYKDAFTGCENLEKAYISENTKVFENAFPPNTKVFRYSGNNK